MSNYRGYSQEDNTRRKANNTGESIDGIGTNQNVKSISTKHGQLSARDQVAFEQMKLNRLNKKQPIKTMDQMDTKLILALNSKYGCKIA